MRIDLTVRSLEGIDHDVAVRTRGAVRWPEVVRELDAVLGKAATASGWWSGGLPLGAGAVLGRAGLRTGALLTPYGTTAEPGPRIDVVGGVDAGQLLAGSIRRAVIGRDPGCDLVLHDPAVSRRHLEVEFAVGGVTVRELAATHPATLDGVRVGRAARRWPPDAFLRVGDTHLALTGTAGSPGPVRATPDGALAVTPRRRPRAGVAPQFPGAPSTPLLPAAVPWVAAAIPAVAGIAMALALGSPQFLAFALLSPLALLGTAGGERLTRRRRRRRCVTGDKDIRARIAAAIDAERVQRRRAVPDPATVLRIAQEPLDRLWERARGDVDLLDVRIGLAATPSDVRVGDEPAAVLDAVPAVARLSHGPLGIVAPPDVGLGVARWLVAQLAVHCSPSDVRIVVASADPDAWTWTRWLPHAAPGEPPAGARSVLVLDRVNDPGTAMTSAPDATICLAPSRASLPVGCAQVVSADADGATRLRRDADGAVLLDRVSVEWADRLARSLAPLVDATATASSTLPASCRLGDLLGADGSLSATAVAHRWRRSRGSADAVVGLGPNGAVRLDLDADGPHALVGGTTGAGKSVLLQTLVASLAASHPPDELAFVLVDYKGGAAFAECAELPHVVGLVTDLDEQLTARALASLRAELRRRERLLADVGAGDLAAYRAAGTGPALARLVLVVDEFATLRAELPDFVTGLTSIAQRGRSLGLHLILATQRPGGAITPEIRANCSLRIALRTTDAADSRDIIEVPDAAALPRDRPGRALVWTAGTVRPVQVARVDEPDVASRPVEVIRLAPGRQIRPGDAPDGPTELQQLVSAVRAAAVEVGVRPVGAPWLPPLPERLDLADLPRTPAGAAVAIGLVDHPDEPDQRPLTVDLGQGGALLVAGAPRSGRTSTLLTLARAAARQLDPGRLHLHAIDPNGDLLAALAGLPHLGTATDDPEVAAALLDALGDVPDVASLLLVDGWEQFVRAADEWDHGRSVDAVLALARTAARARRTIVLAGDRTVLAPRVTAAVGTRLLLRLPDRSDYTLAGVPSAAVPRRMPPGRALLAPDGTEVQLAVTTGFRGVAGSPVTSTAPRLRSLPRSLRLADVADREGLLCIGVAAPRGMPVGVPIAVRRFLVAGDGRSGRSTVLCALLDRALRAGAPVGVLAPRQSPLRAAAAATGVRLLDTSDARCVAELPGLLLVDDVEAYADDALDAALTGRARAAEPGRSIVVAARTDTLALTVRGVAHEIRRDRIGLLLRPGRVDGEMLGVRVPAAAPGDPPGRGVLIPDPSWDAAFGAGPMRVQVGRP